MDIKLILLWGLVGSMLVTRRLATKKRWHFHKYALYILIAQGILGFAIAFGSVLPKVVLILGLFTIIVAIHELGHVAGARLQGIKVTKFLVMPFFGAIRVDETNMTLEKHFWVVWAGPATSIPLVLATLMFYTSPILRFIALVELAVSILNCLPILVLDGSKMLGDLLAGRVTKGTFATIIAGTTIGSIVILGLLGVNIIDLVFLAWPIIAAVFWAIWQQLREKDKPTQEAYSGDDELFSLYQGNRLSIYYAGAWLGLVAFSAWGFYYLGGMQEVTANLNAIMDMFF